MKMKYNLDFTTDKDENEYITKREVLDILSQTTGTMGKDFLKMQQTMMRLIETIEKEQYNRERDIAFILGNLEKMRPHIDIVGSYLNFCKAYDKKHQNEKENN